MKLFNTNLSPYCSRVRIAIYAKGLPIEIAPPPGGLGSPEYKKQNPTGKVPALEVDGAVIPESEAINEFLEDRFPTPALRPADPVARARMRALVRFGDLYLAPVLSVLFAQMNPKTRDAGVVAARLAELAERLDQLEALVVAEPYAAGAELSLADCALAPVFFFFARVLPVLGAKSALEGRPKLARVGEALEKHAAVSRVLAEMGAALAERMGAANR